jgi:hypothetical protein
MTGHRIPELRQGNKALDYLVACYQPMDAKLQTLIDSLPKQGSAEFGLFELCGT